MSWTIRQRLRARFDAERNLLPDASRGAGLSVCLVSPSPYRTGMSSLGFQTVYRLLATFPGISCERAFLPDREEQEEYTRSGSSLLSLEFQRPLADFDVIAFSTSFEPDFLQIPHLLRMARIPIWSRERTSRDPLIVAGGAAFFINPEPVADFLDLICIGEGEDLVPPLAAALLSTGGDRSDMLSSLAGMPGFYVPALTDPEKVLHGEAQPVKRVCADPAQHPPATSVILTPDTEFGDMFLIEVSRGCPRGCRFCSSGFIYAPFRQQSEDNILAAAREGLRLLPKIGLVGAAVSDHNRIGSICRTIVELGGAVSVSSLRLDRLDGEMLEALKSSGHRTIAIAPEGGSQRLRDLIRKNLTEMQILSACEEIIGRDILNLKLYVIIGLPTETEEDLEELVRLVTRIRERMVDVARTNRRLGEITLSINPFIPKPFTPFQWCGMEPLVSLERKVKWLCGRLRRIPNVQLKVESLKGAYFQALLSRGSRNLAPLLAAMSEGNSLKKSARQCGLDTDHIVQRTIPLEEPLPWGLLETADGDFLATEFLRAFRREDIDAEYV